MIVASLLPDEAAVTWLLTILALVAVFVPFRRGLALCREAFRASERVDEAALRTASRATTQAGAPLGLLMMRVLEKSLRENARSARADRHPTDFVFDASRQYVLNEYDLHYTSRISMYASLLPPIGFIGTTGGMLVLFVSMQLSDSSLEMGALAVALCSSIAALLGFSVLEGMKIRLYSRLLASVGDVQALFESARERNASSSD